MSTIDVLGALASKLLGPFLGASPEVDRACAALSVGRSPCMVTRALVSVVSSLTPPGAVSNQEVEVMGASTLFLSFWMARQRPMSGLGRRFRSLRIRDKVATIPVEPLGEAAQIHAGAATFRGEDRPGREREEWLQLAA